VVTVAGQQAVKAAETTKPRTAIPIHYNDFLAFLSDSTSPRMQPSMLCAPPRHWQMRTRNNPTHHLLIDAILARDGAWVIEEEWTDESHRPCCLIRFGVGRQITAALMTRSREWRRVVYSADVERLSHKEIAEMINTPVPIAVSRLHRGRRWLRTPHSPHIETLTIRARGCDDYSSQYTNPEN
jgi:hypothetical protein